MIQPMKHEAYEQAYGKAFASAYNQQFTFFATQFAPRIRAFFDESERMQGRSRTLLDVACGTGQLAAEFLRRDYRVIGIDLSPHMIEIAAKNNADAVADGRARFEVADAAAFKITDPVSFAVSTFDALNHLPDADALAGCFASVYAALDSPGMFVFDLNTAKGLERWNSINVHDHEEFMIVNRGIYPPGADRAYTSITGFTQNADGTYDRFKEFAFNTVFSMAEVARLLVEAGFVAYAADGKDLAAPVDDAEELGRAFFVCMKD
jgi:SAM-dependent methyltransferase